MFKYLIGIFLVVSSFMANAGTKKIVDNIDIIAMDKNHCWFEAAEYHGVNPWLLMSIAYVESGFNPKAINKNKNGSTDVGMMQINSIWFPVLKKYNINRDMLNNPCYATYVGAWILSKNIDRYGYTWRAIGSYNSANLKKGHIYAKKVYQAYDLITKNKR